MAMRLATTLTRALLGLKAPEVVVEAHVSGGLPQFTLIGLIETFWSAYFSVEYKDVAAFSILAIVLIFMPSGILGRPEVEKV